VSSALRTALLAGAGALAVYLVVHRSESSAVAKPDPCAGLSGEVLLGCLAASRGGEILDRLDKTPKKAEFVAIAKGFLKLLTSPFSTDCGNGKKQWLVATRDGKTYKGQTGAWLSDHAPPECQRSLTGIPATLDCKVICCGGTVFRDGRDAGLDENPFDAGELCSGPRLP
jgi:hypothetical protein